MKKIDGMFNRDLFPKCNPNFWGELDAFNDALKDSLLIEKLQQESGIERESYESLRLTKKEKEIIDKLIFWKLCSGLENRYAVTEILLNKALYNPSIKKEGIHILEELYCGRLFPEEQMKGSKEFENHYKKMNQAERDFAEKLSSLFKEEFYKIIDNRVVSMSEHAKESFIYGFQYAAQMFMSIFISYNSGE